MTTLRKAMLLYNPVSGRKPERRAGQVEAAATVLRDAGVDVAIAPTQGPGLVKNQVRQLIADGCDTIIACGGDGTIHDCLQGIVGSQAQLGVIPLGTANSMANDLRLKRSPAAAARQLLHATARRIAVGHIECAGSQGEQVSRYFTVAAGIGVDAEVFFRLSSSTKRSFGLVAYYAEGLRLWWTHPLNHFEVEVQSEKIRVSQLLAVRIRNFGGLLRELAPGASLDRKDHRVVLFATRSRAAYMAYTLRNLIGAEWQVNGIDLAHAETMTCSQVPGDPTPIYVEADGELLGLLPAKISIVQDALTLLVPADAER